jgi:hypothetical protein
MSSKASMSSCLILLSFSNDLALERYDDSTPGSGLPQDEVRALQPRIQDS